MEFYYFLPLNIGMGSKYPLVFSCKTASMSKSELSFVWNSTIKGKPGAVPLDIPLDITFVLYPLES